MQLAVSTLIIYKKDYRDLSQTIRDTPDISNWEIIDEDGDMIAGIDKGLTGYSNWKYRMNGIVTYADGKYEGLVGHQVHMNGQIEWTTVFAVGVAIGPVQIN